MPFVLLIDSFFLIAIHRRKPQERIGAIFFLHGLGDIVISANAINTLSDDLKLKGMRSCLFVEPAWVDFCERFINVDEVRAIVRKDFLRSLIYRLRIIWEIGNRYNIAIQPHFNRHTLVEDSLVRVSSNIKRLGNAGGGLFISAFERWLGDPWYDQLITLPPEPVHDLVRQQQFLQYLGYDKPPRCFDFNKAQLSLNALEKLAPRLLIERYLIVVPFSSSPIKNWPLERFAESASQIARKHDLTVVVIGSELVNWPESEIGDYPLVNLSGKTSIDLMLRLINHADLVLGNDSGVFHISVALEAPVLMIGGGGMPVRFFPYPSASNFKSISLDFKMSCFGCRWNCIYPIKQGESARCMLGVGVEEVLAAAEQLLKRPN